MREIFIALVSSGLTVVITSIVNHIFANRAELRKQANSYKVDILTKVYTPIYKLLAGTLIPGDGYEGVDVDVLYQIDEIVINNIELVDPQLERILWSLKEDQMWGNGEVLDEDKKLLKHVEYNFTFYRKSLGLPFDKRVLKNKSYYKFIRPKSILKIKK